MSTIEISDGSSNTLMDKSKEELVNIILRKDDLEKSLREEIREKDKLLKHYSQPKESQGIGDVKSEIEEIKVEINNQKLFKEEFNENLLKSLKSLNRNKVLMLIAATISLCIVLLFLFILTMSLIFVK